MNRRQMKKVAGSRVASFKLRALTTACAAAVLCAASGNAALAQEVSSQAEVKQTPPKQKTGQGEAKKKPAAGEKASAADTQKLGTIVVHGIRNSLQSSLHVKESSDDIVEAVSAEDIGKLPDVSIADSLARLPGLATQRVNGEATAISIRGLAPGFAGTTLNGREQATIGENRGVEYDQYPAELINGATVYKTPDASLVGQGLSGTVDLHTINPLELPGRTMVFNLRGQHNTNGNLNPGTGTGDSGHRLSFSYIDQFFNHTLGLAIGFAQIDQPIQEKQYQAWWWSVDNGSAGVDQNWGGPHTPGMPDNVISQEGMQLRAQSQNATRNGLMAVLEWAPSDVYYSKLDMYYSTFNKRKFTNGAQWSSGPWDNISYSGVGTSPGTPYPIVTTGTISGIAPILQNEYTKETDKLYSIGWKNTLYLGDWTTSLDLSSSSARVRLHDAYLFSGLSGGAFTDVAFTTPAGNGYPMFTPGANFADPATMVFTDPDGYGYNGREEFDRQSDRVNAVRLQVSHPLGWIFSSVDFGLDYSDRTKTKHADVNFAWLDGNGSTQGTYQKHFSTPVNPAFLYGPTSLGYGGIPGILNYNVLDAMYSQFYLTEENGAGDWSRNYTVEEKVPLAYAKFNIQADLAGMPLVGNVGAQFVHTDQSSDALQTDASGNLAGAIHGGTTYNKVLPSLNLKLRLSDGQYLRFGLAKTMARGRIDDEKVSSSAWVSKLTSGPQAGQVVWSGSGGNPQLKPYVAVGIDLSWEKYFGKASYVSVAAFRKNLLNYIYNKTILNYDFSGYINNNPTLTPTSQFGSFTLPENGTGGSMNGLELAGALEGGLLTPVLEGFGVLANYSLTNSNIPTSSISAIPGGPTSLPGLSRKVGNIIVYYERNGFSARVAYRYRSSFTGEAVALFDQLGYTKILANRQTDLQLGYEFAEGRWKGLSILLQVNNLGNSPDTTVQVSGLPNGVSVTRPLEYDTWGRTYLLGFSYKL